MNPETWQHRLRALEDWCPWAPEPIHNPEDLIGRQDDIDSIVRLAQMKPAVIIHGETGVGKTSLFSSLSAQLSDSYYVLRCTKWAVRTADADDAPQEFEQLLAAQLKEEMGLTQEVLSSWFDYPQGFLAALQSVVYQVTGKLPFLALDQFEEFLRVAPPNLIQSFRTWLSTNALSPEPVRVILSLRSEYLYRLQSLLNPLISASRLEIYPLPPLTREEDIQHVIRGLRGERPVSTDVANALAGLYIEAASTAKPFGLLPLKSTLYSLFWRANPTRPDARVGFPAHNPITMDTVSGLIGRSLDQPAHSFDAAAFTGRTLNRVFAELVDNKLRNCQVANGEDPVTLAVLPQVLDQIAAMRSLLATANFKEHRQLDVLFQDANQQALDFVFGGTHHDHAQDAIHLALRKGLDERNPGVILAIRQAATEPVVWERDAFTGKPIYGLDGAPWAADQDPDDKTSGAWLGLSPSAALTHLARTFSIAVQWLSESNIARVTWESEPPGISLFHDQLSDAIRVWGAGHVGSSESLVESLVTSPFSTLGRRLSLGQVDAAHDAGSHRVIANVRWTRDQIIGDFRDVAFVNCDLRNTRFSDCRFEGVAFLNCTLDGTLFERCTFAGVQSHALVTDWEAGKGHEQFDNVWASLGTTLSTPKLALRISPDKAEEIATLRGFRTPTGEPWLYSAASGIAALPLSGSELHPAADGVAESVLDIESVQQAGLTHDELRAGVIGVVTLPSGGVAFMGGRVSALMFSRCTFERPSSDDGTGNALTLAYVGGSSVDFVEQDEVDLAIYGSAIRGLSFSRPIDAPATDDGRSFRISVSESALVNTWIGSGVRGYFRAYHSTLQSLTSLSRGSEGFRIQVDQSENANQQYVNPERPEDNPDASPAFVAKSDNIEYKTLYRSRPAASEYSAVIAGGGAS